MTYGASRTARGGLLGRIWESPSHDRTLTPPPPACCVTLYVLYVRIPPIRAFVHPLLAPRETPPKRDSLPVQTRTAGGSPCAIRGLWFCFFFPPRHCSRRSHQKAPQAKKPRSLIEKPWTKFTSTGQTWPSMDSRKPTNRTKVAVLPAKRK